LGVHLEHNNWKKFIKAKELFRKEVDALDCSLPKLKNIQQKYADNRTEVSYRVETPVVFNSALDDITIEDKIKLILVADNPGRREQESLNKRYLVGPSGKIAQKFFRDNPSFEIDFYKNVIILNKTPIHSPRTVELKELCLMDSTSSLRAALEESQKKMADLLFEFYKALNCPVWITGYSEMKKGGIFESYTERLKDLCAKEEEFFNRIFIYRHFSMNQFTIDLKKQTLSGETTEKTLERIGKTYRNRILC
jgi:hypothetical protein